uniref:Uncharacterized protein n=1 Tax=Globodera rostochiensis TaxID=31243 RepID=A0A914HT94_GLORO
MEFWILILVSFSARNSLDKTESAQLEETPLKIIDEIFGEGWWDKVGPQFDNNFWKQKLGQTSQHKYSDSE